MDPSNGYDAKFKTKKLTNCHGTAVPRYSNGPYKAYYPRLDISGLSTLVSLLRCATCQILSQNDAWAIALHHSGNKYLNVTECRLYIQTKNNPLTPKNCMQMILYH